MVKGILNSVDYIGILQEMVIPMLPDILCENDVLFQDDNAPIHRAKKVEEWKKESGIDFLPWPAQSPDLSPIEHLWGELERRVRKRTNSVKSARYLKNVLQEEWNNIPSSVCEKLVESMVNRITCVINSNGFPTRY